ncbi:hypothetical protein ACVWYU_004259 [Pseudomonas sp. TE12234]
MVRTYAITCRSEPAPGGVPTMVANDNAESLTPRGVLRFIASRLAPTRGVACSILFGRHKKTGLGDPLESGPDVRARPGMQLWLAPIPVGAGLPAMVANDNAESLTPRGVLRFIASRLAPTRGVGCSILFGRHKKTGLGDPLESGPDVRARPGMQSNCGSEPARDGDGSGTIDAECADLIASRLAPTGACGVHAFSVNHHALRKCGITFSPMFFRVSSCAHCGTVPIWQMNRISSAPASIRRCT